MGATVRLHVTKGPLAGRVFELPAHDTFIFGRAPDCHARLAEDDTTASRHHFLLEASPPLARLRDLGSLNGTRVNGQKHGGRARNESPEEGARRPPAQVDLRHGDHIRVGHTEFEVEIGGLPPEVDFAPLESEISLESLVSEDLPPEASRSLRDYAVGRLLGRGGMGAVFLATRRADGLTVALKVMLAQAAVDETARETFLREIEVTRSLAHPAIVRLLDHGSSGDGFFFAMEYCPGGSAADLLHRKQAPLPVEEALRLAREATEGLAHAHAHGFIHRDLKPENLLLGPDGRARVTDFGLAKSFQQAGLSGLTATGTVAGTLTFMPREQLTSFRLARPASDVWSMGATLYHLLTQHFPRDFPPGQDPLQVILKGGVVPLRRRDPRLPERLCAVVDRAVSDDMDVRYRDGGELLEALLRLEA